MSKQAKRKSQQRREKKKSRRQNRTKKKAAVENRGLDRKGLATIAAALLASA